MHSSTILLDDYSETEPLLKHQTRSSRRDVEDATPSRRIYTSLLSISLLINLAVNIMMPALARIFESAFCSDYYSRHGNQILITNPGQPINESLCKLAPIQKQVATLRGSMEFWDGLPCLLFTLPFGILADSVGRKLLFRLNLAVIFLKHAWVVFVCAARMPLWYVNLAAILNLIGGGNMVAETLFCVILTDVTETHNLTTIFFRLMAMGSLMKVIAPTISSLLMHLNPWAPALLSLLLFLAASILSLTIPETLHSKRPLSHRPDEETPPHSPSRHKPTPLSFRLFALRTAITSSLSNLMETWLAHPTLFLIASIWPLRALTMALDDLLNRYASYRYHIPLASATLLYSLQAFLSAAVLLLVLPALTGSIERRIPDPPRSPNKHPDLSAPSTPTTPHPSPSPNQALKRTQSTGLTLVHLSLVTLTITLFLIGASSSLALLVPALALSTLAAGLPGALRSLAASLVAETKIGLVFSGLAVVETLCIMGAFPVVAGLWGWAVDLAGGMGGNGGDGIDGVRERRGEGAWVLGLPFYVTALLAGGMSVVMFYVRGGKGRGGGGGGR